MVRAEVPSLAWHKLIERRYGLKVRDSKVFHSAYRTNAVKRIVTDKGLFALKHYRGTEQSLSVFHRRMRWLMSKGYEDIPKWIKTVDNSVFTRWQGKIFYLVEWLDGRPFAYTNEDSFSLGETLRLLHELSVKTGTITGQSFIAERRRRISRSLLSLKKQTRFPMDSQMDAWFQVHRNACIRLLETADKELQSVCKQQNSNPNLCAMVHGDVTGPNIVVVKDSVRLIDWERLSTGLPVEECAKSVANIGLFRTDLMNAILKGYRLSERSAVEKTLFRAFFRIPREVIYLMEFIQKGGKRTTIQPVFQTISQTWTDRMNAIQWIDKHFQ